MYAFRVTDEAEFSASFGDIRFAPISRGTVASLPYGERAGQARGGAMLASALAVGALFSAMVWMNVAPHHDAKRHMTTIDMPLSTPPSAPKPEAAPAQQQPAAASPQVSAPVEAPPMAAAIPVTAQEAPVAAAPALVVAPPAPPAPVAAAKAPVGPAEVGDMSARLVSFAPPSYPLESRRAHEEGTVVLALLLGTDGRVSEISVSGSSGSARLDKAALEAVRKWRWAPLMRGGEAVQVRGHLKIPFTLKA
jgi:protein TonB